MLRDVEGVAHEGKGRDRDVLIRSPRSWISLLAYLADPAKSTDSSHQADGSASFSPTYTIQIKGEPPRTRLLDIEPELQRWDL